MTYESLYLWGEDANDRVSLCLRFGNDVDAMALAADIARKAAAYKLATECDLDSDAEQELSELKVAEPIRPNPAAKEQEGYFSDFSVFRPMSEESARMGLAAREEEERRLAKVEELMNSPVPGSAAVVCPSCRSFFRGQATVCPACHRPLAR